MSKARLDERHRRGLVIARNALKRAGYTNREIKAVLHVPWQTLYKWAVKFQPKDSDSQFRCQPVSTKS